MYSVCSVNSLYIVYSVLDMLYTVCIVCTKYSVFSEAKVVEDMRGRAVQCGPDVP